MPPFDLGGSWRRDLSSAQHARIRLHLVLVPVYVAFAAGWWSFFHLLPYGSTAPDSGMARDFAHFYVQGVVARMPDAHALYDQAAQAAVLKEVVPGHPDLSYPPVYGPQVAVAFLPLAWLPYEPAMYLWMVISTIVYGLCCRAVWHRCPALHDRGWVVAMFAIAAPALRFTLGFGQVSALGLICMTAAYIALRAERPFLAGLAIGSLAYKPPLGIAAAFVFLCAAEWRILCGAVAAGAVQLSVGVAYWGPSIIRGYWDALLRVPDLARGMEPHKYHMHSWRAFFELFGFLQPAVLAAYVGASFVTLLAALVIWRSRAPLALRFGALSAATILVDPHVYVYDLLLLTPALIGLWDWVTAQSAEPVGVRFPGMARGVLGPVPFRAAFAGVLYGTYLLPLMGGIVTASRVQTSVLMLTVLLATIAGLARTAPTLLAENGG